MYIHTNVLAYTTEPTLSQSRYHISVLLCHAPPISTPRATCKLDARRPPHSAAATSASFAAKWMPIRRPPAGCTPRRTGRTLGWRFPCVNPRSSNESEVGSWRIRIAMVSGQPSSTLDPAREQDSRFFLFWLWSGRVGCRPSRLAEGRARHVGGTNFWRVAALFFFERRPRFTFLS